MERKFASNSNTVALMHTPHLDSHKHPRTDGGVHATTQLYYSLLLPQP